MMARLTARFVFVHFAIKRLVKSKQLKFHNVSVFKWFETDGLIS